MEQKKNVRKGVPNSDVEHIYKQKHFSQKKAPSQINKQMAKETETNRQTDRPAHVRVRDFKENNIKWGGGRWGGKYGTMGEIKKKADRKIKHKNQPRGTPKNTQHPLIEEVVFKGAERGNQQLRQGYEVPYPHRRRPDVIKVHVGVCTPRKVSSPFN